MSIRRIDAFLREEETGKYEQLLRPEDELDDEDDPDAARLRVDYPSDCRDCTLTMEGVDASVVCDGATLEMRFSRNGSPRELIEAFAAVRKAFALTKDRALAGLL